MTSPRDLDFAAGMNRLLVLCAWVEDGRLVNLDNNVHLAQAITMERGQQTSQSHIQALRQGKAQDPRWSVVSALCRVLTDRTGVVIDPAYFFDADAQTQVNDLLATRLDLLRDRL